MAENKEIPEIVRPERSGGLPLTGILIMGVLSVIGIGLVIFAVVALRAEHEAQAISATVAANASQLPTVLVVQEQVTQPTATDEPTPTPTDTPEPTATAEATATEQASETPAPDTETATATATATDTVSAATALPSETPTATATATQQVGGQHGVSGSLVMCSNKPSYATNIEGICFIETITNHTDADISYGVLGVQYANLDTGETNFHTSWRGDLLLAANCTGPSGSCGGAHRDEGLKIGAPGTYTLTMAMCFSDVDSCLGATGDWETLTAPITITLVDWTPTP